MIEAIPKAGIEHKMPRVPVPWAFFYESKCFMTRHGAMSVK